MRGLGIREGELSGWLKGNGSVVCVLDVGDGGSRLRNCVPPTISSLSGLWVRAFSSLWVFTATLTCSGTRTQAKVRSWVTQPPHRSQARIFMYASLWSLLGISVEKGLGVNESMLRIFVRGGKAGNFLAKAEVAELNLRMSAFGDTM